MLAEVVRSGLVEGRHYGAWVQVAPDGTVLQAMGDPEQVIYPRSANKPFQALGLLRAGLPLDGAELAIATSSHAGEPVHLEVVRRVLAQAGLDESALQTPPSYPLDPHEHARVLREGGTRAPILMDCSGKHAAMLLTCRINGWPIETYLDPEHPVQRAIRSAFDDLVGPPPVTGVDGCGAPLFATTLRALAVGFGRVARRAELGTERLADAIVAHPELVSGQRRPERRFLEAFPGSIGKTGAEAVFAFALPDGTAWVAKIDDGSERPLYAVMGRALERAGLEAPVLHERPVLLGGGQPVGTVRPVF